MVGLKSVPSGAFCVQVVLQLYCKGMGPSTKCALVYSNDNVTRVALSCSHNPCELGTFLVSL